MNFATNLQSENGLKVGYGERNAGSVAASVGCCTIGLYKLARDESLLSFCHDTKIL